jgi:hypothetical protein
MNRRQFFKTAAVGAAGLALLPSAMAYPTEKWIDLTADYVPISGVDIVEEATRQGEKILLVDTPVFMHPKYGMTYARTYSYPLRIDPQMKRIKLSTLVMQLNFFFWGYYATHIYNAAILSPLYNGHRPVIVRVYHDWRNHPQRNLGSRRQVKVLGMHANSTC